jgi:hypothetical protein
MAVPALLLVLAVVAGTCASGAHAQLASVSVQTCTVPLINATIGVGSTAITLPVTGTSVEVNLGNLLDTILIVVDGVVYRLLKIDLLKVLAGLNITGLVAISIGCPGATTACPHGIAVTVSVLGILRATVCALPV